MVKRITVSFPDYVHDKYFANIQGNKSKFVEEHFILGVEANAGEFKDYKIKHIEALKEIRNKEEEIRNLKLKLGRYESRRNEPEIHEDAIQCANCGLYHPQDGYNWTILKDSPICADCIHNHGGAMYKKYVTQAEGVAQ